MTDGGVSLHRYCHGEVGGPCQHHLAGGQQEGEELAVLLVGPDPIEYTQRMTFFEK